MKHQLAIQVIQPLIRFVEDKQCGLFYQRAANQQQTLLAVIKIAEADFLQFTHLQQLQPLTSQQNLFFARLLIEANRVVKARYQHFQRTAIDAVL